MILREFIERRKRCPFCNGELSLIFHSSRRQSLRFEGNKIVFVFGLYSKNNRKEHTAGYAFDLDSNSWCVEFYDKDETHVRLNKVSHLMRSRIKELDVNMGNHKFYVHCTNIECGKYICTSNSFDIDFKSCSTGPLQVESELFRLVLPQGGTPDNGTYKVYHLNNFYKDSASYLQCEVWTSDGERQVSSETMKLPIIPFVNKEETINRINKLLVFS